MANKKKPRPKEPVAVQREGSVDICYPDRILQPALAPLKKVRCCPKCGIGPVSSAQRYSTTPTNYLFECPRCVDRETCRPTRWQEPRR